MFDEYAKKLIDELPELPDLDRNICRRTLSKAYFFVICSRLGNTNGALEYEELYEVKQYLRKLVNSLESVAIFDRLNGIEVSDEVANACAFVAAESLGLLLELTNHDEAAISTDVFSNPLNYIAIESALLYMIGGYDINAVSVVSHVKIPLMSNNRDYIFEYSVTLIERLSLLCKGKIEYYFDSKVHTKFSDSETIYSYELLIEEIRINFYHNLSRAANFYMKWLGGQDNDGKGIAIIEVEKVRNASQKSGYKGYTEFADIYHLSSLLLSAIEATSKRATMHIVPIPNGKDELILRFFHDYLKHRAEGDRNHAGRPFLWPSAIKYINRCLPGPQMSAVIAMPTGSGKSFVAELAVAHSLSKGWVLYLAPTNSLAHQIRRDLKYALKTFKFINVCAFVGGEEYTTLLEEQLEETNTHYVAVMTPEKCALALRLYPERFANCSLCVFDECHLMNDQNRGVTVDILFAQIFKLAPQIYFLLMSAMISNPGELANWLKQASGKDAISEPIKWRPSRTLRGLLILEKKQYLENYEIAKSELMLLPKRNKKYIFETPVALIAGLSGPWTFDGKDDYKATVLPAKFPAKAIRDNNGEYDYSNDSWKNTASRIAAEMFANNGIPSINFILTSKHHAFSSAEKVSLKIPGSVEKNENLPQVVGAWLSIADAELGVPTVLRDLLLKGIAVHTSSMLQCEQAASEWMFANKKVLLMFATGTLAQGLNLPAIAVIIAGTSMGDPRDVDAVYGVSKVNSLILNGFGRASRPGFSNQGIAVLVSDIPYFAEISNNLDPSAALNKYGVMGESDASISVHSPVEKFIDSIIANEVIPDEKIKAELVLTTLLAEMEDKENHAGHVLSRTFAAYCKRELFTELMVETAHLRVTTMKSNFLKQTGVPEWINMAAMKAGVDLLHAWNMWAAYKHMGGVIINDCNNYKIIDWVDLFFNVMSLLPPKDIISYLPGEEIKSKTVLTMMRDSIIGRQEINTVPWEIPTNWLDLWEELKSIVLLFMKGESYKKIAQVYLGKTDEEIGSGRCSGSSPIPSVFKFLRVVVDQLAVAAGCFLALMEFGEYGEDKKHFIPESLQSLPLCIRNGCDSLGTLAWFRFCIRQRVCAHALQKEFPVPDDIPNDSERANWVKKRRKYWLRNDENIVDKSLLYYAKIVITSGYEH